MAGKKTQAKISAKIRKLKKEGKPIKVAIAQAINTAGRKTKKKKNKQ